MCCPERDITEGPRFRKISRCTRSFLFLVVHTTHLNIDVFLIFGRADNMSSTNLVLSAPRRSRRIRDIVSLDLDIDL